MSLIQEGFNLAGYIINLDSEDSLKSYVESGIYATKLKISKEHWARHHEGTFADYVTMKQGDNIFFFIKRMIYGIGELVNLKGDCKFSNFPGASNPGPIEYSNVSSLLLWDEGAVSANQRWLCTFKPSPSFFTKGVDMDEVLSSDPAAFRMLRAFWKLSFIKVDDTENQALRSALLKANQDHLSISSGGIFKTNYMKVHKNISGRLSSGNYRLDVETLLQSCADGKMLIHEMALEAAILHQLVTKHKQTVKFLGEWDYLSHQVIASPFKPIDYMDKMDIFGYRFITGFSPTLSKYLVIELKAGIANKDDVDQLLKYVDWLRDEYSFGNYSQITAVLITHCANQDIIDYAKKVGVRQFTKGTRPTVSQQWKDLSLYDYKYAKKTKDIVLNKVL